MKKPCIGLVLNLCGGKRSCPWNGEGLRERRLCQSGGRSGGVPILLPVVDHEECLLGQIDSCSGFLFPGGQDIHPKYYAAEPRIGLRDVNMRVDAYQLKLMRCALESEKPILGICRGHQLLNIACGGTLLQDLSESPNRCLKHSGNGGQHDVMHTVSATSGSMLEKLLGCEFVANSNHHQAIMDVGTGLTVVAAAADGVIESVLMSNREFVLSVQWHPEEDDFKIRSNDGFVRTAGQSSNQSCPGRMRFDVPIAAKFPDRA